MRTIAAIALLFPLFAGTVLRNGTWQDDEHLWGDTIRKTPGKARAYNELGLHFLSSGRPSDALTQLLRSLELDPYQQPVYVNIGLAYERLGDAERAAQTYERAAWLSPGDPAPWYNLGVLTYNGLHDRDRALGYFLKARDLDPREPDVHHWLARIYLERGEQDRAVTERALYEQLKHRSP